MTRLLKHFGKKEKKRSQNIFSQSYPKIVPSFSSPFAWAPLACSFLGKRLCDPTYLGWKKQPRNFIQVVLREFFPLWCHLIFFSSEILSWCFTSFLRHTLHLHGISLNKITVFVESQRFFVTTKTAKARTDLGLSGVIRLPTQIMHYLLQGKSLKITKHLHQVWSPKNW